MALLLRIAAGVRAQTETSSLTPAALADRQVGIAYSAWHDQVPWHQTWDVPQLGPYLSNDPRIIRQHAEWLSDANVDFIYIDWSNNLNTGVPGAPGQSRQLFIEGATKAIFDEYLKLPRHPKIVIMIGFPGDTSGLEDGRLLRKANQVWDDFAANPGPHFALAGSFNEWSNPNEEPSPEVSKDIEPSRAFGKQYLDILKKQAAAFKTGLAP
jgi:hypothetical protein